MTKRNITKTVTVGDIKIGSRHRIAVQSMTKVRTADVAKCVRQVKKLTDAGCDLVRIAVPTRADTQAFTKIVKKVACPLIADIHFSAARAIEAIEGGAAKIRLNPGNIKKQRDIDRIIDAARQHRIAIRIGVNEASIRDLKKDTPVEKRTLLMLKEMKRYVRLFEKRNFDNLVLSAKSSDTFRTIEINRKISEHFNYPIHIGLTHAGLPEDATIPSAVALGTLLSEGIGDTIRVSVAGDPVEEVVIANKILSSLGLVNTETIELVVCPTCGRCEIDVVRLARKVKKTLTGIDKPIRVAVMGCVVNGPGEAADADLAVCAATNKAFIYKKGKKISIVKESEILPTVINLIKKIP